MRKLLFRCDRGMSKSNKFSLGVREHAVDRLVDGMIRPLLLLLPRVASQCDQQPDPDGKTQLARSLHLHPAGVYPAADA